MQAKDNMYEVGSANTNGTRKHSNSPQTAHNTLIISWSRRPDKKTTYLKPMKDCFKNSSEEDLIKLWMKLKLSASSLVDEGEWEDASQHNKDCPICFYPMDDKDMLKMICCQNSLCKICNELVKDRQSKGLLQNGCIFATTSNFGCTNCK